MRFEHVLAILRARFGMMFSLFALILAATAVATYLWPKQWSATTSLVAEFRSSDPVMGQALPPQMIPGYLATQADIVRSQAVAQKVVRILNLDRDAGWRAKFQKEAEGRGSLPQWIGAQLIEDLRVRPARESAVLSITYTSDAPKAAADIANAFARAYIDTNLELRTQPARDNTAWFDERTRALRAEMENAQQKLSAYQTKQGITASEERVDQETSRLDQLNAQLATLESQTYDASTRHRLARDYLARGAPIDAIPEVLQSPIVQSLKSELSRQEAQLREQATIYGPNHPLYRAQVAEVESVREKLREESRKVLEGLENAFTIARDREAQVRAAAAAQKNRVLAMKRVRDELSVLQRESDNAQRSFDLGKQRLVQNSLESQLSQTNIAVLTPAVEPVRPASPIPILNLLVGAVVGLLAAIGTALVVELANRRVRASADLAEAIEGPVLMTLPRARRIAA